MFKKKSALFCILIALCVAVAGCVQQIQTKTPDTDGSSKASTDKFQVDKNIFAGTMVEMSWEDVQKEAQSGAIVLFPISVVEEHGPHMDLSPDIYLAYESCILIKNSLEEKGVHAVIAPPDYWGINVSTGAFPGSFTLKPDTFKAVLRDSTECLKKWGFTKIFYVSMHGDPIHRNLVTTSAKENTEALGIDVVDVDTIHLPIQNRPTFPTARDGKFSPERHAGADETSLIFAMFPDKVDVAYAKKLKPQSGFSPLGYMGDPANFDLEDGTTVMKAITETYALEIEAYLKKP
ncbi:MAG: creatininase family protein [Clostridia bacterium]|nr:creatininase family protein [Clostridia bacterium]